MKNKLIDLNNHLFAQLELLRDEGLSPDQLALEIRRAKAITEVSGQIVNNATLALRAAELAIEQGERVETPEMLRLEKNVN